MKAVIFIGSGKISYGKLSQALDYGALTVQIAGDFDDAMARVQEVSRSWASTWSTASIRSAWKGRRRSCSACWKALRWEVPDWIVVPGGNLGNSSAFGKAFMELKQLGLIDRMPRLAVINAAGADTLYELYENRGLRWNGGQPDMDGDRREYYASWTRNRKADTIASAIEINRPVNLTKCLRALEFMRRRGARSDRPGDPRRQGQGRGRRLRLRTGQRRQRGRAPGFCAREGVIGADERVVCILTGHQLKDPTATVAYHTTDQEQFNKVSAAAASAAAFRQPRRRRAQRSGRDHQGDPINSATSSSKVNSPTASRCRARKNASVAASVAA
jgi:threonine synthase